MSTISPAKLAANQANAQKSTGPRTPEGKARVAQNAITHGLFAKAIVLEGRDESNQAFQSLLDDLTAQFQPQSPLESLMVQRVATAAWRIQRAHRFESRVIACAHKKSHAALDQIAEFRAKLDQVAAEISECESLLTGLDSPPPKNADDQTKNAYRALEDRAAKLLDNEYEPSERKHIPVDLENRLESLERTQRRLSKKLAELEQSVAIDPYCADPESLIPDAQHLPLLLRYENALDRQLHRALAALRQSRALQSVPRPSGNGVGTNPAIGSSSRDPVSVPLESGHQDWFNRQSQIANRQSPQSVPSCPGPSHPTAPPARSPAVFPAPRTSPWLLHHSNRCPSVPIRGSSAFLAKRQNKPTSAPSIFQISNLKSASPSLVRRGRGGPTTMARSVRQNKPTGSLRSVKSQISNLKSPWSFFPSTPIRVHQGLYAHAERQNKPKLLEQSQGKCGHVIIPAFGGSDVPLV